MHVQQFEQQTATCGCGQAREVARVGDCERRGSASRSGGEGELSWRGGSVAGGGCKKQAGWYCGAATRRRGGGVRWERKKIHAILACHISKRMPHGWYGHVVHYLTSLGVQKCIFQVHGPMWHTLTSSRAAGAFNSKSYITEFEKWHHMVQTVKPDEMVHFVMAVPVEVLEYSVVFEWST
jgi:hypothetical protein